MKITITPEMLENWEARGEEGFVPAGVLPLADIIAQQKNREIVAQSSPETPSQSSTPPRIAVSSGKPRAKK